MKTKLPILIALLCAIAITGCASGATDPNAPRTDQQRLDDGRNVFRIGSLSVNVLIAGGFLAKDDPGLKQIIFTLEKSISEGFVTAQTYLNAGNKVDFNFWLDQTMTALEKYLLYEAQGETKHKLANPATRPSLPKAGK